VTKSAILERDGPIGRIVLNQPDALNAIGPEMAAELAEITAELERDAGVRCVIVTGSGAHFMAGGDIRHFADLLERPGAERDAGFSKLISDVGVAVTRLRSMPKPVIAAVRGAVAGFGFSLMCACDLVIASETTSCKLAYCQLGASPDGGGSYTLPRLIGVRRAMEVALLDERIDAARALQLGLVSRVVPDAALDEAAMALAQRLAPTATAALGRTKRLLNASYESDLAGQLEAERLSFLAGVESQDFAEGVAAFLAKRKPVFHGR
jgi:2-(1,2-epoxy-1,2-dihydrophenyl)acetyl-CoA isomerase